MAAYAALVSLEQVIDHTVPYVHQDFVSTQIRNSDDYIVLIHLCRKEEMKSLNDDVIFLQKHLEEFPKECVSLESRIRDVAHQLDDIIECFLSGQPYTLLASDGRELHWSEMKSGFRSCSQDLHSIVEQTAKMEANSEHDDDMQVANFSTATDSSTDDDKYKCKYSMVGFEEDLNEILDRATGHDRALQFIPIVGMGGIGKTTLARNVFDHPSIVQHFDIRSWVTVSQDYRLGDILLGLLPNDKTGTQEDDETLILHLYQHLNGRRFFIVLDDMWHEEAWDKIMRAFPDETANNGSRIIITTRLSEVAAKIDSSSSIHQMQLLNLNQSWSLMCEKVFGKNYRCPHQLKNVGEKIARNCKGLPLAVTVIAGLLKSNNNSQDYWEEIARNVSETAASNDQLDRILSLSYDNLPHHMRACFLYMGVFPEDWEIEPELIIQLCVAEGFVKPKGGKSMETVAKECFEDLVRRNLVLQEPDENDFGKYVLRMHDILRELCLKKAAEEYFFVHCKGKFIDEISFPKVAKGHHRIITDRDAEFDLFPYRRYNWSLHSFICVAGFTFDQPSSLMLFSTQFMLLRILHQLTIGEEYLHLMTSDDSILFKLIHLRLLSIRGGRYCGVYIPPYRKMHISASLVQLQHLQALTFNGDGWGIILPLNIWRMPELRHLITTACFHGMMEFSDLHYCSGTMECLQTLSLVKDFKFTNDAAKIFPNLKTLGLRYNGVRCDDDWAEYCLNNLVHLHQLEDLKVELSMLYPYSVLHPNLAFPNSIKRLHLRYYRISGEMMSNMSSLLNLELLKLDNCEFDECELFEEEFPQLKYLEIYHLTNLKEWIIEETNFPCLEELSLLECDSVEISVSICDDIPSLEKLVVHECCGKTFESAKRIQDEQLRNGNSTCQIIIEYGRPGPGPWR